MLLPSAHAFSLHPATTTVAPFFQSSLFADRLFGIARHWGRSPLVAGGPALPREGRSPIHTFIAIHCTRRNLIHLREGDNMLTLFLALFLTVPGNPARDFVQHTAPNFHLKTLDGHTLSLKSLRGQVVLLNFWASWCKESEKELPRLAQLQQRLVARGLRVIAISVDHRSQTVRRFLQKHPIAVPTLWDRKQRVARRYSVEVLPSTYLIDRNGQVRWIQRGFSEQKFATLADRIDALLDERTSEPTRKEIEQIGRTTTALVR